MNRKTKLALRAEADQQASAQRAARFGQFAFAAMLRGQEKRKKKE